MGVKTTYMNFIDCTHSLTSLKNVQMCASQHGHDGEETIQPDCLETICPTTWLNSKCFLGPKRSWQGSSVHEMVRW